ncbi:hypothetical protein [Carnobacterium sp.]|uniref:hypothetical protein n=1 Tax=Carnobacterium sp. TaxID=48221 RepID=UPI0028A84046|nr:hypothetical protein [Carnobacterium sp.]
MKSISDYLGIDAITIEKTGAFNAILGVDSKLFVDPPLIYNSTIKEFSDAKNKIHKRFKDIMILVRASRQEKDKCWNSAVKLMTIPETKGISIGYSTTRGNGNGIGRDLAETIIRDAHQISEYAKKDSYFFELLGLFEKNIGSDRISDLVINILENEFISYTKRIFEELGKNYEEDSILPTGENMILIPKVFLSNLPHADFTFKNEITDESVRAHFNAGISASWKDAFDKENENFSKKDVLTTFLTFPDIFDSFIDDYLSAQVHSYNFKKDPDGEVIWYEKTKQTIYDTKDDYISLVNKLKDSRKNILEKSLIMCQLFKDLVENNKLSNLFYKESYIDPKREDAIQLVFYGVCYFFSQVHGIDLTPESNTGRGPVDFKVSTGNDKVLIEIKKTLHSKLQHGYFEQLEEYKISEKTDMAIFLIIILEGDTSETNLKKFKDRVANTSSSELKSEIVYVDARKKDSASK